jgi:hypothetical protein
MLFDIKMDGLQRKARLVAGGHTTETPASITYSSVVTRDSVRIAFLIAALNDLDILAADIGNAYLNAPCREKIWTVAGKEFGSNEGTVMIIKRALYGLKSSGAAWRTMFAQSLLDLGYKPTLADPDVYLRKAVKPDGFEYYEMVLVYVDDTLCVSHEPKVTMEEIAKIYRIKEGSLGPPERYLGADISKYQLPNGKEAWAMSARSYVKAAVKNIESILDKEGLKLRAKTDRPMVLSYRPEVDTSPVLNDMLATSFQHLLGVLRWSVELGRIDIHTEVSMLSSHNAMPRVGHLNALYDIFAYLKKHENSTVVFDPDEPKLDQRMFNDDLDWTDFYGDVKEAIPPNMPEPLGRSVVTTCYVDADHAGNLATRRSQTGILIYVNKSPIMWYSKRQNTVETSSFGSEFVAMKTAVEMIEGLRYKLRMFGIPIDGPTSVLCDNNSVVINSSVPHSTLNKKHCAICYHRTREAVAAKTIRIAKEDTHENLADMLTKPLPTVTKRYLCRQVLY